MERQNLPLNYDCTQIFHYQSAQPELIVIVFKNQLKYAA